MVRVSSALLTMTLAKLPTLTKGMLQWLPQAVMGIVWVSSDEAAKRIPLERLEEFNKGIS